MDKTKSTQVAALSLYHPLTIICTWFLAGKIRPAPGTWGTLAALPVPLLLVLWLGISPAAIILFLLITLLIVPIGIISTHHYMKTTGVHDASEIVIDEVLGIFITILACAKWLVAYSMFSSIQGLILLGIIFLAFRFFDIVKPFPINYCDRHVKGAFGVMLDDVIAAVYAAISVHIILYIKHVFFPF